MASDAVDVNALVDAQGNGLAQRTTALLAERGLQGAWITASASRFDDPADHDDRLHAACAGQPSLHAIPVLVPPTGASSGYARAQRMAADQATGVARLCPGSHRYPLAEWVLSPLPELCARSGLTLMLDFQPEPVRWTEVVSFARAYPSLPLIVLEVQLDHDRAAAAALDAAPNLLLHVAETHRPDLLGRLVELFGASRFVWGSSQRASTDEDRGAVLGLEQLPHESRAALLHGNAEALQQRRWAEAFL
jgi:predicted TIM-barrel fold metal-dependent hydrolase